MRPFVENFPFFSIFLAILAAIVTAAIRSGRISYWITIGVCAASALLNGWVLEYTYAEGVSFTYAMGRFLAPLLWRAGGGTYFRTSCRRSRSFTLSW